MQLGVVVILKWILREWGHIGLVDHCVVLVLKLCTYQLSKYQLKVIPVHH